MGRTTFLVSAGHPLGYSSQFVALRCAVVSNNAFPIVSVRDLPAAQQFYARLGFTPTYRFPPDGKAAFVTMSRDDATIGIAASDDPGASRFASQP